MMRKLVATGLSYGLATPSHHAKTAVAQALERAGLRQANSVILFLSPDCAHNPQPVLRAAARAARCTQVFGATGSGLLTDEDWVLDSPGAAAMVFGDDISLKPLFAPDTDQTVLSLCTPDGLSADWLDAPVQRLGAVSADAVGHGPFCVWNSSRVVEDGYVEAAIDGVSHALTVSQGIRALTAPIEVAEVQGFEIVKLGNYPALNVLVKSLPAGAQEMDQIPLHLLISGVTFGDPETAISEGRYRLNHIIAANPHNRSITLAHPLNQGERLFWGMRDALASERDMRGAIAQAHAKLGADPDFGLMFPCMGRGPLFYGNRDRDVELLRNRFPGMPFIGFYGNGEIGPLEDGNHLHQYSNVLGLFRAH